MSDFNKKSFKFLSNNFYALNIVQISIICCQLLIYENRALPWVVYGSITCILFKMINCACLFMETESSDYVNLELPLKYGQNISGHICQGHVDTVSKVTNLTNVDKSTIYEFSIDKKFYKFLVEKASILINGVS